MNLLVPILLTAAALGLLVYFTSAAPLEDISGSTILMPGEFPIIHEVNNGATIDLVSYNGDDASTNSLLFPALSLGSVGETDSSATLREVDGRDCGLIYGTIGFNGTCQLLLAKSVCSEGEWLVKKNNNNDEEAECVPRPCSDGQLQYEGVCVNVSDTSVCNDGQMLYVDFTGNVHCDCMPDYFYDPWQGHCFTQHDRGACNFGKYLEVTESGGVECVSNPCVMEGFYRITSTGKCYRKMYRGICQAPFQVIEHHVNQTVQCINVNTRTIFSLPTMRSCAPGSRRDYARVCRVLFRVPSQHMSFRTASNGCQLGFVKDPRGTCRKTHRLFG